MIRHWPAFIRLHLGSTLVVAIAAMPKVLLFVHSLLFDTSFQSHIHIMKNWVFARLFRRRDTTAKIAWHDVLSHFQFLLIIICYEFLGRIPHKLGPLFVKENRVVKVLSSCNTNFVWEGEILKQRYLRVIFMRLSRRHSNCYFSQQSQTICNPYSLLWALRKNILDNPPLLLAFMRRRMGHVKQGIEPSSETLLLSCVVV